MRFLHILATWLCVFVAMSPVAAQEGARPQAKISAAVQNGFARLTFDWSDEVAGAAQVSDGVDQGLAVKGRVSRPGNDVEAEA